MKDMKLDESQQKVVDFPIYGTGNLMVQAMAGSGKTTTILKALDNIPKDKKVLVIAYNRSIVKALKKKYPQRPNVKIRTYHAQGLKLLASELGQSDLNVNPFKYSKHLNDNIEELSMGEASRMTKMQKGKYMRNIRKLLDFSRYNMSQNVKEVLKVAEKYYMDLISNEAYVVVKLMKWGQDHLEEVDFTDLTWAPNELNLEIPYEKYDWVMVDEAQDSSPCQQQLFQRCLKSNGRCIVVGDGNQCINEWCGSDREAFNTLSRMRNLTRVSMNVSYRCNKATARKVSRMVPEFRVPDNAEEGITDIFVHLDDIKAGDTVLCRNNEPLVRAARYFMSKNIPCKILGKSIAKEMKEAMAEADIDKLSLDLSEDGVFPRLYKDFFYTVYRHARSKGITVEESMMENVNRDSFDAIKMMEGLAEGITDRKEFDERVENLFIEEKDGEDGNVLDHQEEFVLLCSIHKSKGLEFDRVFEACPSMCPSKMAETPEQKQSERNLCYVRDTRARHVSGMIYETDLKPSIAWDNATATKKEMMRIRDLLMVNFEGTDFNDDPYEMKEQVKVHEESRPQGDGNNRVKFRRFL